MSYLQSPSVILRLSGVNALVQAASLIGTTSANFGRFVVESVRIIPTTVTGSAVISPIIKVGFTATAYNDLVTTATVSGTNINVPASLTLALTAPTIATSTGIYVNVSTAGTGYTVYTFDIYIRGFYEQLQ